MPITNISQNAEYPVNVQTARSFTARLIGLLGTKTPNDKTALHIVNCTGVHTFGMKYPLDLIFLDKDRVVLHVLIDFGPNKMTHRVPATESILELPPGSVSVYNIQAGDRLDFGEGDDFLPNFDGLKTLFHWPMNIAIALLWSRFVISTFKTFTAELNPLAFGVLVHHTLIFFLFLIRKKSVDTSRRFIDWLIPLIVISGAMLLRPENTLNTVIGLFSGVIQGIGILCMTLSLISIGRSFGVVPANRTIKYHGAYKVVRHPIYSSESLFYIGFIMGNFTIKNMALILIIIGGQLWRLFSEEKLLSKDSDYRTYMKNVPSRLFPGIF